MQKWSILANFFRRLFSHFWHLGPQIELGPNFDQFRKIFGKKFPGIFFSARGKFGGFLTPRNDKFAPLQGPTRLSPKKCKFWKKSGNSGISDPEKNPHFTNLRLISAFLAEFFPISGGFSGVFPLRTTCFGTLRKNRGFWAFYKIRCLRRFSEFWKKVENFPEIFRDFRDFRKNRSRPPYFTNLPAYDVILGPFLGQNRGGPEPRNFPDFKKVGKILHKLQNPLLPGISVCTKKFLVYRAPVGYGADFFRSQKVEVFGP